MKLPLFSARTSRPTAATLCGEQPSGVLGRAQRTAAIQTDHVGHHSDKPRNLLRRSAPCCPDAERRMRIVFDHQLRQLGCRTTESRLCDEERGFDTAVSGSSRVKIPIDDY